eukprot:SAG22_NODE_2869_length_2139_cov_2.178431_1_plen_106_part_10
MEYGAASLSWSTEPLCARSHCVHGATVCTEPLCVHKTDGQASRQPKSAYVSTLAGIRGEDVSHLSIGENRAELGEPEPQLLLAHRPVAISVELREDRVGILVRDQL